MFYRSIFDDEDDDDNVAATLGITNKPVINGDTVKKPAEKQSINEEVQDFIPLIIILICVALAFLSYLLE